MCDTRRGCRLRCRGRYRLLGVVAVASVVLLAVGLDVGGQPGASPHGRRHYARSAHAGVQPQPAAGSAAAWWSETAALTAAAGVLAASGSAGDGSAPVPEGALWRRVDELAIRPSPVWPFRGVVNRGAASAELSGDVLQYWDADTGEYSEVLLSHTGVPGGDCSGTPVADEHAVELSLLTWPGVVYSVPWGDEAYPVLFMSQDALTGRSGSVSFGAAGSVSVVFEGGEPLVRVSDGSSERYYSPGMFEFAQIDSEPVYTQAPENSDNRELEDIGDIPGQITLDGTDGYHWGVTVTPPSTMACPEEYGFIFAIETGELVACGWTRRGGAFLVGQPDTLQQVDTVAFPETTEEWDEGQCVPGSWGSLDISTLKIPLPAAPGR